jgi:hypothetical protein
MRLSHLSALAGAFLAILLAPSFSYGAAQLAAGARTSAAPTSTNPQQRAIQISFDPEIEASSSFNVDSFRLSVQYDFTKIDVGPGDINFIGPFTETNNTLFSPTGPGIAASSFAADFSTPGIIGNIAGNAPLALTQPGDVFLFSINFTLKPNVSFNDDILTFTIFANSTGDFIHGTDPNNPNNTAESTGVDVIPTVLVGTYNQLAAQVPLPSVFPAGALAVGLLAIWRRRPASKATF